MKKKVKVIIIIFLLLVLFGLILYYFLSKNKTEKKEVKVINEISSFDYTLKENQSKLYEKKFKELKKILSEDNINYNDYAKKISEMFIIDFYTLDNKESKNDIGGLEFIKDDMKSNFIDQSRNTFYRFIELNSKNRNQELPVVSEIVDVQVENTTFFLKDLTVTTTTSKYKKNQTVAGTTVDAYKVTIKWNYEEDLGYEKEAKMILVKDNNKLYIVEMN